MQEWADRRKDDRRPQKALEATEAWLASPTTDVLKVVKGAAKDCTAARNETFGDGHRVPQAARHVAWTCGADDASGIFDAIQSTEEELLAQVEQSLNRDSESEEEEEFGSPPEEETGPPPEDLKRIEHLFEQSRQSRKRAYELKAELDRLGVFKEYEDRFLDLFKKS